MEEVNIHANATQLSQSSNIVFRQHVQLTQGMKRSRKKRPKVKKVRVQLLPLMSWIAMLNYCQTTAKSLTMIVVYDQQYIAFREHRGEEQTLESWTSLMLV